MTRFTKEQKKEVISLRNKLTNQELFTHLKVNFSLECKYTTFRTNLYQLGLQKCKILRWTKDETDFLIENYKTKGNVEIAKALSRKGRIFTKKNIEKKMRLLNLKRSETEIKAIRINHKLNGVYKNSTARIVAKGERYYPEGFIKIHVINKTPVLKIKISGIFIPYARYRYEQLHGKIPEGYKVYFRDCNFRNVEDENLILLKAGSLNREQRKLYKKHYKDYFEEISQKNPKVIDIKKPEAPVEPKQNSISVKIGKMIIKVKPGTDIKALTQKYESRKFAF